MDSPSPRNDSEAYAVATGYCSWRAYAPILIATYIYVGYDVV